MRSPLTEHLPDAANYSDLGVMRSNAGWYIGTYYRDPRYGWAEPGSRDSQYYATSEEAFQAFEDKSWDQRENP